MGVPDLMDYRGVGEDMAFGTQSIRKGHIGQSGSLGGKRKVRKQDGGEQSHLE